MYRQKLKFLIWPSVVIIVMMKSKNLQDQVLSKHVVNAVYCTHNINWLVLDISCSVNCKRGSHIIIKIRVNVSHQITSEIPSDCSHYLTHFTFQEDWGWEEINKLHRHEVSRIPGSSAGETWKAAFSPILKESTSEVWQLCIFTKGNFTFTFSVHGTNTIFTPKICLE